jgi:hypothetical protein
MGLLDDAIRQHLDLKRQHGADESELRRKENEALGPARREAPAGPEDEGMVDEAPLGPEEAPVAPEEALPPVEDPAALDPEEELAAEEELAESEQLAEEDFDADLPPEPAPREPYPDPEGPFATDDDLLPEPDRPAEPGSEDVLEETPDFLQETPDHDKLWFEQKPPRDFDFDDDEK